MANAGLDALVRTSAAIIIAALYGCHHNSPPATPTAAQPPRKAADVNTERLSAGEPDQWLTPGRDANGTYYSPLQDIDTVNVGKLGFAWDYRLGTNRGQESTPLVIDGVMYATSNFGRVYALDAASGKELWKYDPHIDGQWARYACCDAVNRGLAAFDGRLFAGALDGWLHALDAQTGQLVWKVDTLIGRAEHKPYTLTGAPLLAGDLIIVGNGGADFAGARGYVSAYDRKSGAFRWRFFTVPRNPAEGAQDQAQLAAAVKTWDPRHRWDAGSGGTVWDGMAYDPALRLVYIGTANAAPYNMHLGGRHGGDELYAASIIAIHVDDGSMAWYYQTTPGDRWDFDSTQKLILADVELDHVDPDLECRVERRQRVGRGERARASMPDPRTVVPGHPTPRVAGLGPGRARYAVASVRGPGQSAVIPCSTMLAPNRPTRPPVTRRPLAFSHRDIAVTRPAVASGRTR